MTAVGDVKMKTKAFRSTCAAEQAKVMKPQQSSTGITYISVFQPPGRGPVPGPGINYTGHERPEETTICYKISLVQLITNLNVILYLSTCHTVYISVLILFMIMT